MEIFLKAKYDRNEIELNYYPDIQDAIKQFEDNNDDNEEQDKEHPPLAILGVAAWRQQKWK